MTVKKLDLSAGPHWKKRVEALQRQMDRIVALKAGNAHVKTVWVSQYTVLEHTVKRHPRRLIIVNK